MPKRTNRSVSPLSTKRTARDKAPRAEKTSAIKATPDSFCLPIGWHFSRMDSESPWACTFSRLRPFREQLLGHEGRSCHEVFSSRTAHSHGGMSSDVLCKEAQDRLAELHLEQETLFQIGLGNKPRLWGIMSKNIFKLLWLDLDHSVYPVGKK